MILSLSPLSSLSKINNTYPQVKIKKNQNHNASITKPDCSDKPSVFTQTSFHSAFPGILLTQVLPASYSFPLPEGRGQPGEPSHPLHPLHRRLFLPWSASQYCIPCGALPQPGFLKTYFNLKSFFPPIPFLLFLSHGTWEIGHATFYLYGVFYFSFLN